MIKEDWMISDLHIHSRFSRACSKNIDFENLVKWAKIKGINLLGTGDFTHPIWFNEIKEKLKANGKGFYYYQDFPFIITGEISLIYTQEKGRRIHLVLLVPDIETAEKINSYLDTKGRRDYDGRPIFKISGEEFVKDMMNISEDIEVICAHCLIADSLVHTKEKLKKIQSVTSKDFVLTHKGRYKKVKKVYERFFSGKVIEVVPACMKVGTFFTPEHLVYSIKTYKTCKNVSHTICKPSCAYLKKGCKIKKFKDYKIEWRQIKELEKGDVLVYPRYNVVKDKSFILLSDFVSKLYREGEYLKPRREKAFIKNVPIKNKIKISNEFCRLIGYYLAEGYCSRDFVAFTFNEKEKEYIKDVEKLLIDIFGPFININIKKEKSKGVSVFVYSKLLKEFFETFYVDKPYNSYNKKLPEWFLNLTSEKLKELVIGWWRGDGGYSTSVNLFNQFKQIFIKLGIIPSTSKISAESVNKRRKIKINKIGARKIIAKNDLFYFNVLSFFEDSIEMLDLPEFKKFRTKLNRRKGWMDKNYIYLPIIKINKKDYKGKVYNLEVEDDNSYLTENLAVHNCWTPWFGVFGSMSGFDSLKECFKEQFENIHAIETGMSSSPDMNWRIKELEDKSIISFSDAHCVHPDTLITLKDGYVLPISEIEKESIVAHADLKNMSYKNGIKIQYSKIVSPKILKEIKYSGGEIKVSDKHRFYVFENNNVIEKYAFQLKQGDLLIRLARASHKNRGSMQLKKPVIDVYFLLKKEGFESIKSLRKGNNLLQRELADLLGMCKDNYWNIGRGRIKINEKILKKLSVLFQFDYESFLRDNLLEKYFDFSFPEKSSAKLFEILGYLIGEGCFTIRNKGECLLLNDKNKELLKYYQEVIEELFSCKCRLSKCSYQNSYELFAPSHVAQFFKLNFPEAVLKTKELKIPRLVFSSSFEEIAGFLRGFFDAEGCMGHHSVDVCSSNKLLLYQIDSLLKKLDIFSTVSLNQLEKVKQKYRHRLYLYGENLRKFDKKINFNHEIKKSKLRDYVKKLKVLRKSKIKRKGDFILSKIKSIENVKSDVDFLYDLAVPKYENYIANQIVVHNSFWPFRLGREATIFKKVDSYKEIIEQIRNNEFLATIETDPAYGKYHFDGHRNCNFSCSSEKTKELNGICPVCESSLTIGVDNRVEQIADNPNGFKFPNAKPFYKLLPLHEIIALSIGNNMQSTKVWTIYNSLIKDFNTEFNILLNVSKEELLKKDVDVKLVNLILKNREAKIRVKPGYDGIYGEAELGDVQTKLF